MGGCAGHKAKPGVSEVAQEVQVQDGTLQHGGLGKARQTLLTKFTFAYV